MSKRENGTVETEEGQTSLVPKDGEQPESSTDGGVIELANTSGGCWKVLADGRHVKLSDKEWRKELARLLAPAPPAP
ncbi:MAG: hypothetical protein O7A08_08230 [SAR324 cluster bacterium]|nr:hypothetical protein [SAR324 cluster bacterium]